MVEEHSNREQSTVDAADPSRNSGGEAPADSTPQKRGPGASVETEFHEILHLSGMHAALEYLNARTRCRFTGLFHVDPPLLRNVHLFDRENRHVNVCGGVHSIDIGYCGVVCQMGAPFLTSDAAHDPRLKLHPAKNSMLAYAGAPIELVQSGSWGTICHFDLRPRIIEVEELSVLGTVTPILADWVRQHFGVHQCGGT